MRGTHLAHLADPAGMAGESGTTTRGATGRRVRCWTLVCLAVAGGAAHAAEPASTPRAVRERIDSASALLADGRAADAVTPLAEAAKGLEAMAQLPKVPAAHRLLVEKIATVRGRLEQQGIDVSGIPLPGKPAGGPAQAAPRRPPAAGAQATPVNFSRQVAPVLARHCGGCHVAGNKGGFQMVSYEALMATGMVQRGVGASSRLVEVILTGDMPRGGGKVGSEDVGILTRWIDGGAHCDPADVSVGIDVLARRGSAPAPVVVAAPQPAKLRAGDVSFAADVAPVLLASCVNCHDKDRPEGGLRMASLETLVKGGRSGPAVLPGKGADSLLVQKLRGRGFKDGQRMPLGGDPLPGAVIAAIEKWIDQGARADLLPAAAGLEAVAAAGQAKTMDDSTLAAKRVEACRRVWRQAIPDEEPSVVTRGGLTVVGNLPASKLEQFAEDAAAAAAGVREQLVGTDRPLLKGGVVVLAFRKSYDYSALWQTVVGEERPKGATGHAGVSGQAVYAAVLVPSDDDEQNSRLLVAEQIAAAAMAGRSLPGWFARGVGRAVAVRVAPQASLVQTWRRDLPAAVAAAGPAATFLAASGPDAHAAAAGGFVTSLNNPPTRLKQFVTAIDSGTPFEEAFGRIFRGEPQKLYESWSAREAGKPVRSR